MLQTYRTNLTSSEIILVSHVKHILAEVFCQQVDVNPSPYGVIMVFMELLISLSLCASDRRTGH